MSFPANAETKLPPSKLKQWDILIRRYSIPLILGIFTGLLHANLSPNSYHYLFDITNDNHLILFRNFKFGEYHITLRFLINDCFMVFFFGFVAKHAIKSLLPPHGNMYPLKRAITPIISSCFGIIVPIMLYLLFTTLLDATYSAYNLDTVLNGWAIPMSTDIALCWTVATFIFSDDLSHHLDEIHPCITFLLLLSMFDDIIGLLVIGIFYSEQQFVIKPLWIFLILFAMLLAAISNHCVKIHYWWYYLFIVGTISWIGFTLTGIHSALSFIPIMPFMVIKKPLNQNRQRVQYDESEVISGDYDDLVGILNVNDDSASDAESEPIPLEITIEEPYSLEMLDEFEKKVDRFVEYGLFFFTYSNAGVELKQFGNISLCIFFSLLLGKIIGVSFGSYLVNKLCNIPLPFGMELKQLPLVGFCASLSLIVSLFISETAFVDKRLQDEAKMGILCAIIFGIIVTVIYRIFYKKNNR